MLPTEVSRFQRSASRRALRFRWGTKQQAVLWRDIDWNRLRPDAIAALRQPRRADDIDRHRTVNPTGQSSVVAGLDVVTTRQHGDSCSSRGRPLEHAIRQRAARMAGDDDVGRTNLDGVDLSRDKADASREAGPFLNQHLMQF